MDLPFFIKMLWNKKWVLISLVLFAMVITYFSFTLLPATYHSTAILSTGIVKKNNIKVDKEDIFIQQHEIDSDFSNLIATMKSRTSIRFLTYHLLLHDLNEEIPFREPDYKTKWPITPEQIQKLQQQLEQNKDSVWTQSLGRETDALLKKVALAYKYDFESLNEDLQINRIAKTDYIDITFESEHPELSEFAVNHFCETFIRYNQKLIGSGESKAVKFYTKLSLEKKNLLDQITLKLNKLRQNENIVNLDKQTETTVSLIKDLTFSKEEAQKEINGHRKNIQILNQYLQEITKDNIQKQSEYQALNQQLTNTQEEIKQLIEQEEYNSKGKEQLAQKEGFRKQLIQQLTTNSNQLADENQSTLQLLFEKKVLEELDLSLKEASVASLDQKINQLTNQSKSLVLAEAEIEVLNNQKELAMQEYLDAVSKLNEAQVIAQGAFHPLQIFEYGQIPLEPEKSKRLLFTLFAGALAGSMGVLLLFLLQILDSNRQEMHRSEV